MRSDEPRIPAGGGNDHHRLALVGEAIYQLVDFNDGADVDPARRLVEDDESGSWTRDLAIDDLLLVAAGQLDHLRCVTNSAHVEALDPIRAGRRLFTLGKRRAPRGEFASKPRFPRSRPSQRSPNIAVFGHIRRPALTAARYLIANGLVAEEDVAPMKEVTLHDAGNDFECLRAACTDEADTP